MGLWCWHHSLSNEINVTSENKISELSQKIDILCRYIGNGYSLPTPQTSWTNQASGHATPAITPAGTSPDTAPRRLRAASRSLSVPEYEGGSALSAHTAFATRFLKTAVDSDRSTSIPAETASVLKDLQRHTDDTSQVVAPLHEQLPNAAHPSLRPGTPDMTLPPAHVIFAGIRIAKGEAVYAGCILPIYSGPDY